MPLPPPQTPREEMVREEQQRVMASILAGGNAPAEDTSRKRRRTDSDDVNNESLAPAGQRRKLIVSEAAGAAADAEEMEREFMTKMLLERKEALLRRRAAATAAQAVDNGSGSGTMETSATSSSTCSSDSEYPEESESDSNVCASSSADEYSTAGSSESGDDAAAVSLSETLFRLQRELVDALQAGKDAEKRVRRAQAVLDAAESQRVAAQQRTQEAREALARTRALASGAGWDDGDADVDPRTPLSVLMTVRAWRVASFYPRHLVLHPAFTVRIEPDYPVCDAWLAGLSCGNAACPDQHPDDGHVTAHGAMLEVCRYHAEVVRGTESAMATREAHR
ncbi:uncharacterized protein AMSG_06352 [Thecamonas trahens ATCC 50062]|uniref:C3H1-type domain-containing protein n=1 Tax=Thecamonas trahens ATCC 50062 TaxID=461836 RepID=A0A0L0DCY9_THETB|nr:hypothetical protein AMSG_06352 [Thecamonas trahens ATCC 50062]KNC50207.1 hypothetical protein AMSG_06352 [Thecamonas trahens ATCC 50062]|eukprot:XP_013757042.1 hypothetical protein AMSG_06352 [Thecamonas trahens ATCC 50062]